MVGSFIEELVRLFGKIKRALSSFILPDNGAFASWPEKKEKAQERKEIMEKMSEKEFLSPQLNEANKLGIVTTKNFFGGTTVFIDKVKIGGVIKDTHGFIFQFKPTKQEKLFYKSI